MRLGVSRLLASAMARLNARTTWRRSARLKGPVAPTHSAAVPPCGLTYSVGHGRSHTVAAARDTSTATPTGELKKRLVSDRTCLARFKLMPQS